MSTSQKPKINPAFTRTEAKRLDLADAQTYTRTLPLCQIARSQGCGDGVEPSDNVLQKLVTTYENDIHVQVAREVKQQIDKRIETLESQIKQILGCLDSLRAPADKLTGPETETEYTEAEAVHHVHGLNSKIVDDEKAGERHHRRVMAWVRHLGKLMTWIESFGLAVFAATALNINFLDPLDDFSGWLLAVVMILVVLFLQPMFVDRSAKAYNHYREAIAEQQTFSAEAAKKRFVTNGVGAALIAAVITSALIMRFVTITDITNPVVYWLMIVLCTVTGVGMPLFSWLAHAWDGSAISRERAGLTANLDESLARHTGLRNTINIENVRYIDSHVDLTERVIPTIINATAGSHVTRIRHAYAFLRIQLGGLPGKPPYDEDNTPARLADKFKIHTSIPSTDLIHLKLLQARAENIESLNKERAQAIAAVQQIPPHPWGESADLLIDQSKNR